MYAVKLESPLWSFLSKLGVQFCYSSEFLHMIYSIAKHTVHWGNTKRCFEDLHQAYEDVREQVNTTPARSSLEMFSPFYLLLPLWFSLAELTLFLLME